MSGNEDASAGKGFTTIYMLRSRRVVGQEPSRSRKRKRSERLGDSNEAIKEQAIEKPQKKIKYSISTFTPDMISPSDDVNMISPSDEEDTCENLSPIPIPEFSPSIVLSTPKVCQNQDASLKELTRMNIEIYVAYANMALEYYNAKERVNLKLVEVTVASEDIDDAWRVHMNFIVSSDDHPQSLLFAELIKNYEKLGRGLSSVVHVEGCCVIEKVDSGNPLGHVCSVCGEEVMHPGPAYGYRIISGDLFKGYRFWEYHPYAYEELMPSDPQQSLKKSAMYVVSARKALEYYNTKQLTNFKDAEVTSGAHKLSDTGTVIHVNFVAQLLSGSEQELFFAELSIPLFDTDGSWGDHKEPFVEVKACCRLEKVDSGNPFGRHCELCRFHGAVHPSPRDGYSAADGDDFTGYDFMMINPHSEEDEQSC